MLIVDHDSCILFSLSLSLLSICKPVHGSRPHDPHVFNTRATRKVNAENANTILLQHSKSRGASPTALARGLQRPQPTRFQDLNSITRMYQPPIHKVGPSGSLGCMDVYGLGMFSVSGYSHSHAFALHCYEAFALLFTMQV